MNLNLKTTIKNKFLIKSNTFKNFFNYNIKLKNINFNKNNLVIGNILTLYKLDLDYNKLKIKKYSGIIYKKNNKNNLLKLNLMFSNKHINTYISLYLNSPLVYKYKLNDTLK